MAVRPAAERAAEVARSRVVAEAQPGWGPRAEWGGHRGPVPGAVTGMRVGVSAGPVVRGTEEGARVLVPRAAAATRVEGGVEREARAASARAALRGTVVGR